jgi:hypothetical protein
VATQTNGQSQPAQPQVTELDRLLEAAREHGRRLHVWVHGNKEDDSLPFWKEAKPFLEAYRELMGRLMGHIHEMREQFEAGRHRATVEAERRIAELEGELEVLRKKVKDNARERCQDLLKEKKLVPPSAKAPLKAWEQFEKRLHALIQPRGADDAQAESDD